MNITLTREKFAYSFGKRFLYKPVVIEMYDSYNYLSESEITDVLEQFSLKDTEENRENLNMLFFSVAEECSQKAMNDSIDSSIGNFLDIFSNYNYEYYSEADGTFYSGNAKGIISYSMDYENITITFERDLIHIINDCIAGFGMFSPELTSDEEIENYDEAELLRFIEERIHWLSFYPEIYGVHIPDEEFSCDEFDHRIFNRRVIEDIENKVLIKE